MPKQTQKRHEAETIVSIHVGHSVRHVESAKLYRACAELGYYWNVARQDWQNIRLTLVHVESSAALVRDIGKPADASATVQDYLRRLVDGGILRQKADGTYKRTKKIDLTGDLGDFGYGR